MTTAVMAPTRAVAFHRLLVAATVAPIAVALLAHHGNAPSVLFLMPLFLGASHVGATGALYLDPELRPTLQAHPLRYVVAPIAIIGTSVVIVGIGPRPVLVALVAIIGVWRLHHFSRQNLGVFTFLARARGEAGATPGERRIVDLSCCIGIAASVVVLAPLGLRVPLITGASVLVGFVLVAVGLVFVANEHSSPMRSATLLAVLLFFAPLLVYRGNLLVAATAYTAAHGAQYLLMMGELRYGRVARTQFLAVVILAWLLLGLPLPLATYYDAPTWVAGLVLGVTVSHFVIDAGVWKMREPAQRAYFRRRFDFL